MERNYYWFTGYRIAIHPPPKTESRVKKNEPVMVLKNEDGLLDVYSFDGVVVPFAQHEGSFIEIEKPVPPLTYPTGMVRDG